MINLWNKQELEVYVKYCKFNNLKYESIWINMEGEAREKALSEINEQMLKIDKPVMYLDFEYTDTVLYSLINFIKEEIPDKSITCIPCNFNSKREMAEYVDKLIQKEITYN